MSEHRPMRVLHVVPSLSRASGGPYTAVPLLGAAIAAYGHRVRILSTLPEGEWLSADPPRFPAVHPGGAVEVDIYGLERSERFAHGYTSPALIRAVRKAVPSADLVHVHSLWNRVASPIMAELRRRRVPYVLTPHGMLDPLVWQRNPWRKRLWAWLYDSANVRRAGAIHLTSQHERQRAEETGWPTDRAVIAPNVLDVPRFQTAAARDRSRFERMYDGLGGREMILFVGRLSWVKNLALLADALPIVKKARPNATLVLVGPDEDKIADDLLRRVRDLGHPRDLLCTGMLGGADLLAAYARADVVALVSSKENFGMSLAEGLAAGNPIVGTTGVGIMHEIGEHPAARMVEPTVPAIAEGLIAMLERRAASDTPAEPDPDAVALAERLCGPAAIEPLLDAYARVIGTSGA